MTTIIQIKEINGKIVPPLSSDLLEKIGAKTGSEVEVTAETGALLMRSSGLDEGAEFKRLKEKRSINTAKFFRL